MAKKSTQTTAAPTNTVVATAAPASATGFQLQLQNMLQGFQKFVPSGFTLQTSSGGLTQQSVVTQLTQMLSQYSNLALAKAQAQASVGQARASFNAALPTARTLYESLKDGLIAFYGRNSPQLAQFGLPVKTKAPLSGIKNAVRAAKARQTRQNNGTLGKRQKAQVALAQEVQAVASDLVPLPKGANTTPAKGS